MNTKRINQKQFKRKPSKNSCFINEKAIFIIVITISISLNLLASSSLHRNDINNINEVMEVIREPDLVHAQKEKVTTMKAVKGTDYIKYGYDTPSELKAEGQTEKAAKVIDNDYYDYETSPEKDANVNETAQEGKAIMIIAAYPNNILKTVSIWSQLECLSDGFDQIIISAPIDQVNTILSFYKEVKSSMPPIGAKLSLQFYVNDRYDYGLWCDVLTIGKVLKTSSIANNTYVGGFSKYDRFLLINDSMMALRKTNEFLESLKKKNASLVSLNYWDGDMYWLESPLRVFSLEGIQTYADKICSLPPIEWKRDCKDLQDVADWYGPEMAARRCQKKCIVRTTEVNVVKHYDADKVHGLYPGNDGMNQTWSNNITAWTTLYEQMNFPMVKVTHGTLIEHILKEMPNATRTCTTYQNPILT